MPGWRLQEVVGGLAGAPVGPRLQLPLEQCTCPLSRPAGSGMAAGGNSAGMVVSSCWPEGA